MKNIKLECWWTDSYSLNQRFRNQFLNDFNHDGFNLVTENPDFTIIFGKTDWTKIQTPKERTFFFTQEPLWSPNENRDILHKYCSKVFIADKRMYPNSPEYIEGMVPMFYGGSGENDNRNEFSWNIDIIDRSFEKSKNISYIVRKDYSSHYDNLEVPNIFKINNKKRTDLGIDLCEYDFVDIYGLFWEPNGKNIIGEIWNKHVALNNYKFSICSENCIQKNYLSEKFWDVILTDTVPIYLGCENIKDYIPEECFLYLNNKSISEMVDFISEINKNADSLYEKYKKPIKDLKNEFLTNYKYNLWEKIKKEINEN